LPTRSAGALLEGCVASVLDQPYSDMELVVADNANVDETSAILERFADDRRLRVVRSDVVLDVTENWNAALEASAGEYLLLIGDDDLLLPGYLETVDALLAHHGDPDCLTYNAYSFVAKNAVDGVQASYYREEHFDFGPEYVDGQPLSAAIRQSVVKDLYAFRQRFPMNMQMTVVARRTLPQLANGLFRSPFPDHYALSALLLRARRWVYSSARLAVVGVSPKSFGHFFHSANASSGLNYLGVEPRFEGSLPGNDVLNAICVWLIDLKQDYPRELAGVEIDRPSYVLRQAYAWARALSARRISAREFVQRASVVSLRDWLAVASTPLRAANRKDLARVIQTGMRRTHPLLRDFQPLSDVSDIVKFGAWVADHGADDRLDLPRSNGKTETERRAGSTT
jgi:glycosyltransferase involved in cell wall biosynthesis